MSSARLRSRSGCSATQCAELGDGVVGPPEREQQLGTALTRRRRASPRGARPSAAWTRQSKSSAGSGPRHSRNASSSRRRPPRRWSASDVSTQRLEPVHVDVVGVDVEPVTVGVGPELGVEASTASVAAGRPGSATPRPDGSAARHPTALAEPIGGHDAIRFEQQRGQQQALTTTTERHRPPLPTPPRQARAPGSAPPPLAACDQLCTAAGPGNTTWRRRHTDDTVVTRPSRCCASIARSPNGRRSRGRRHDPPRSARRSRLAAGQLRRVVAAARRSGLRRRPPRPQRRHRQAPGAHRPLPHDRPMSATPSSSPATRAARSRCAAAATTWPGNAVTDGGVMIDLAPMRGVRVDPAARQAWAQGGTTWRDYNRATGLHGLATTGGVVSTTGIAGLTLGGGEGWLMGRYGMAIDNLLGVELVTADGDVLTRQRRRAPRPVLGGARRRRQLRRRHRVRVPDPPRTDRPRRDRRPPARAPLARLADLYGEVTADRTRRADRVPRLRPRPRRLRRQARRHPAVPLRRRPRPGRGGRRAAAHLPHAARSTASNGSRIPVINTMLDASFPAGTQNYWKSAFLRDSPPMPSPCSPTRSSAARPPMTSIVVNPYHGATSSVSPTATAFPHRGPGYSVVILTHGPIPPTPTPTSPGPARSSTRCGHTPPTGSTSTTCPLTTRPSVPTAYGPNWARLVDLKRRYDPDNIFHLNHNISPATRRADLPVEASA